MYNRFHAKTRRKPTLRDIGLAVKDRPEIEQYLHQRGSLFGRLANKAYITDCGVDAWDFERILERYRQTMEWTKGRIGIGLA